MDHRSEEHDDEERQSLAGLGRPAAAESSTWPTVDGPLGLFGEESVACARRYFRWGFALLPFLWAVNCYYFWPVLRSKGSSIPSYFHRIRPSFVLLSFYFPQRSYDLDSRRNVVRSAIGFAIFSVLLTSWALTFMIGGERLFGSSWNNLVMYNLADNLGLTGWS